MNTHELNAWNTLLSLGAKKVELGGKYALDLRYIRISSGKRISLFCQAFNEVVGRSGAARRHVDRRGCPVFVITDDKQDPDRRG